MRKSAGTRWTVAWAAAAALCGSAAASGAHAATPAEALAHCEEQIVREPGSFAGYQCYWMTARRYGVGEEAQRALRSRLALDPQNQWARLYLACILKDRGDPAAAASFREAADAFAAAGERKGEFWARQGLYYGFAGQGKGPEARRELELALAAARDEGSDELLAEARVMEGWHHVQGGDPVRALRAFQDAGRRVGADGPLWLRIAVLDGTAAAYHGLGDQHAAFSAYQRQLELNGTTDPRRRAMILRNLCLIARDWREHGEISDEEVRVWCDDAAAAAESVGDESIVADLAIWRAAALPPEQASSALRRLLAENLRADQRITTLVLFALFESYAQPPDAGAALGALDEAAALAREGIRSAEAFNVMVSRAEVLHHLGRRSEGIETALWAAEEQERLVRMNRLGLAYASPGPVGFSSRAHRFGASWLLESFEASHDPAQAAQALELIERLHALAPYAREGSPEKETAPENSERAALEHEIVGLQHTLMTVALTRERRQGIVDQLEELELRLLAAGAGSNAGPTREGDPISLETLARQLSPEEALLVVHFADFERPQREQVDLPSWLLSIGPVRLAAYRIPHAHVVARQVAHFRALVARGDDSDRAAGAALASELLGPALHELPPEVDRLIVLADGPVNGLPFGALRLDEGGPPLSARFEITTVPSLAGWLALRREPHPAGDGVIALADPLLELNADRAPLRSAGALLSPVELGPLPHARREVRALSRWLAAPVQVLTGADATERAIKHGDLGRQAILHIAAHALVDDQHPERSAIVLAAGDEDEDGLLQLREIRELPLAGQLVVLSTCESASGPMMDGAGVQTLASAFIEAGARVVVASLWPLPDAAAADVMEAFVARLAHGKSVATALAEAQRDAVRHELPPVAWAGFVVVGDGGFVPFPGGAARRFSTRMAVVVAASGLGAAGIAAAWVLRRRAVSSSDAA